MNQKPRVLKSQADHAAACKRMSVLMDQDFAPNSDAEAEFELLQVLIQAYESAKLPPRKVNPIEAIRFRMEQQGLSQKDLAPFIGSPAKVSEVLSGSRPLSLLMIKRLHKGLAIPASSLLGEDDLEDKALDLEANYEYDKFPLQEMQQRGLFPNFIGGLDKLKARAEDLVKGFMQDVFQEAAATPALLRAPLHQSGSRTIDDYSLLIWRACVIKKAQKFAPRAKYKSGVVTDGWLRDLAKLSCFDRGPKLAHEYLSKHGICLVIEHHFKKTYLDGAAMINGDTPIVALTLRHDRLDNFWFALLHECVHVQKHLNTRLFIADNLEDKTRKNEKDEMEADAGAQEALIPLNLWQTSAVRESLSTEDAIELARSAGVHPSIVAGRIRHETGNWRVLSNLISAGGSVKPCFEDHLKTA